MAITRDDVADSVALLRADSELREAVRDELLRGDFLELPKAVKELARAQAATETALEALTASVNRLVERFDNG